MRFLSVFQGVLVSLASGQEVSKHDRESQASANQYQEFELVQTKMVSISEKRIHFMFVLVPLSVSYPGPRIGKGTFKMLGGEGPKPELKSAWC